MRCSDEAGVYYIMSDWVDEPRFREFEHSWEHGDEQHAQPVQVCDAVPAYLSGPVDDEAQEEGPGDRGGEHGGRQIPYRRRTHREYQRQHGQAGTGVRGRGCGRSQEATHHGTCP